jgi:protein TonB
MKLDLFKKQWLDMVFEGKNKSYGAYDLRKKSPKMTAMALLAGAALFALAIAAPAIIGSILDSSGSDDTSMDKKIVTIKLPPKEKKEEIVKPVEPPPPPVDQVKFVKPEIAKADEVTEEPPKIKELDNKKTGDKDLKGKEDAPIIIEKPSDGDVVQEDTNIYNSAGVEVSPEFPGGINKWYNYLKNSFKSPEDEDFRGGRVIVQFVVEKDGSLTDIKVLRDVGYGTKEEAMKLFNRSPRWTPAEQNGKKVRCTYVQTITLQAAEQ